jgi:branched-chain amino acid transport system substrate-binding protein
MSSNMTSSNMNITSRKVTRRTVLAASAATVLSRLPTPAIAQNAPFKIGLLTVKTVPLAEGGIQMEQGALPLTLKRRIT